LGGVGVGATSGVAALKDGIDGVLANEGVMPPPPKLPPRPDGAGDCPSRAPFFVFFGAPFGLNCALDRSHHRDGIARRLRTCAKSGHFLLVFI
jgi:hypothetical protein